MMYVQHCNHMRQQVAINERMLLQETSNTSVRQQDSFVSNHHIPHDRCQQQFTKSILKSPSSKLGKATQHRYGKLLNHSLLSCTYIALGHLNLLSWFILLMLVLKMIHWLKLGLSSRICHHLIKHHRSFLKKWRQLSPDLKRKRK